MSALWYVLHTKPQKENMVYGYLQSRNFEVFYPSIRVNPVNPRASKIRPLFPRYMFVYTDLDEVGLSSLHWIPSAIGLVQFDGQPSPVADHVIREIKLHVRKIENGGGLIFDGLQCGDPVRIIQGPLAGYEAIFDMRLSGTERVQLLLTMLGRQVKVQTTSSFIEKMSKPCHSSIDN